MQAVDYSGVPLLGAFIIGATLGVIVVLRLIGTVSRTWKRAQRPDDTETEGGPNA